jgi:UDP-glucose:(heptosyl)LPS alpha-1,3-glucosyltransferase
MSKFRLALVRQKYRPDGGAERLSPARWKPSTAASELNVITREWQGPVKPDWKIHICNPRKWGGSAASAGLPTPPASCGSANLRSGAEP